MCVLVCSRFYFGQGRKEQTLKVQNVLNFVSKRLWLNKPLHNLYLQHFINNEFMCSVAHLATQSQVTKAFAGSNRNPTSKSVYRWTMWENSCIKLFLAPELALWKNRLIAWSDVTCLSTGWSWKLQVWKWKISGCGVRKNKWAYQTSVALFARG